jgi:hypothetical protein
MSYTDYLKRMAINRPVLIDSRMTFPDASSYTWRKKLEATSVNRRTDHVINNSQDTPAPRLFSPMAMGFAGSGFGGKVQDASSFTLSRSATSIGNDVFSGFGGQRHRTSTAAVVQCLTRPPASQVVSELGNADGIRSGLNMGYTRQTTATGATINNVGVCTAQFRPLTQSQFVDTIPELKTHKFGSAPQPATTQSAGGRQVVQNAIVCATTNTAGDTKSQTVVDANGVGVVGPKVTVPFNLHSEPPHNPEKGKFITGIQGPQVGGGNIPGSRAPKVGGVSVIRKGQITHRGWATPSSNPYPYPRVPPRGAPAQLKINDANHYKV